MEISRKEVGMINIVDVSRKERYGEYIQDVGTGFPR